MSSSAPSNRKIVAAAAIVLLIIIWALTVALFAPLISRWPVLVQALFYLVMGISWIIPLKPLLRWSETGRWRTHKKASGTAAPASQERDRG